MRRQQRQKDYTFIAPVAVLAFDHPPVDMAHNLELSGDSRKLFMTRTAYRAENPAGLYRVHKMCALP